MWEIRLVWNWVHLISLFFFSYGHDKTVSELKGAKCNGETCKRCDALSQAQLDMHKYMHNHKIYYFVSFYKNGSYSTNQTWSGLWSK